MQLQCNASHQVQVQSSAQRKHSWTPPNSAANHNAEGQSAQRGAAKRAKRQTGTLVEFTNQLHRTMIFSWREQSQTRHDTGSQCSTLTNQSAVTPSVNSIFTTQLHLSASERSVQAQIHGIHLKLKAELPRAQLNFGKVVGKRLQQWYRRAQEFNTASLSALYVTERRNVKLNFEDSLWCKKPEYLNSLWAAE